MVNSELWCGRGLFQKCVSIVKQQKHSNEADWKFITYLVFDAPEHEGAYEQRIEYIKKVIDPLKMNAAVVGVKKCEGKYIGYIHKKKNLATSHSTNAPSAKISNI